MAIETSNKIDPRLVRYAEILVRHSTKVKPLDDVSISIRSCGSDLALEICYQVLKIGGFPTITYFPEELIRGHYELPPEDVLDKLSKRALATYQNTDVFIAIRSEDALDYLTGIDSERMRRTEKTADVLSKIRLSKRWVAAQYPTAAYAAAAGMPLEEYADFVYGAVLKDWAREREKMLELKELMDKTRRVRIAGEDTDLTFSIEGRSALVGDGTINMPDGEVFTSPVENSANGRIFFDSFPMLGQPNCEGVTLKLKDGMVVDFSAEKNFEILKSVVETDEGSRRFGEFGVGTNEGITRLTNNPLFDEKIAGTIHLALGFSYKETGGTNESSVHRDLVKNISPGKVYFDDKVVLENGKLLWHLFE